MDLAAELVFSIMIAGYGCVILWNKKAVIPLGHRGFFKPTVLGYVRINGIPAVILGLALIFGGLVVAFPAVYQLLSTTSLPDNLALWIPIVGLVIIAIGVIGAAFVGMARAFGNEIYTRKQQRNQENKEQWKVR